MNKIASYLNEHLLGNITSNKTIRTRYSTDASILSVTPENVAFPRVTNDIRKIARFSWQLAEKGHVIGLTPRGLGMDTSGGALGKGIVISTATHLKDVLQILPKERLVHVQPGVRLSTLKETLRWQGLELPVPHSDGTVGGTLASDRQGVNDSLGDAVEKLEVVLANGDVIETGRVSKRDLSKKLGLQTFEGEVYRKLEALIEDNQELISKLAADDVPDNTGYKRIADVREKDGSFDLTPLFVGSQGTLGIISEAVLQADFYSQDETIVVVTTKDVAQARDVAEKLQKLDPSEMIIRDGDLYRSMEKLGAKYSLLGDIDQLGATLFVVFDDFSARAQKHKMKLLRKLLKNDAVGIITSDEHENIDDFGQIDYVGQEELLSDKETEALPVLDGVFVPEGRREAFENALADLAKKHHLALPVTLNVLTGVYDIRPHLKLHAVSDKQKLFRVMGDYAQVVHDAGGAYVSDGAEGRIRSHIAWDLLDGDEQALYEQLRAIFDPFGTLNPGVKQKTDIRTLVASLRSSYNQFDELS